MSRIPQIDGPLKGREYAVPAMLGLAGSDGATAMGYASDEEICLGCLICLPQTSSLSRPPELQLQDSILVPHPGMMVEKERGKLVLVFFLASDLPVHEMAATSKPDTLAVANVNKPHCFFLLHMTHTTYYCFVSYYG